MGNFPTTAGLSRRLFAELAEATADAPGVTREAYGPGEAIAHEIIRREAQTLGAEVSIDAAGNLYARLAGRDREKPAIYIGSHLDSVPHGGNYDGAAGVLAGLCVMAELVAQRQDPPPVDLVLMVTRAEESAWFPLSYPGARAALGKLRSEELQAQRKDTGKTLAQHMLEAGFDPESVARGERQLDQSRMAAFIELHIEQGPELLSRGEKLAIVSAISGGRRWPEAKLHGAYAHSGAEPRFSRRDVLPAFGDLIAATETIWDQQEAEKRRLTLTFGRVQSDPRQHGGSIVLGELGFSLDMRSHDIDVLNRVEQEVRDACTEIASRRRVTFEQGPRMEWSPIVMNQQLNKELAVAASKLDLALPQIVSGGGHDAAAFAEAGVPTAMLFLRNENGSHNPHETINMEDFDIAVAVLLRFVRDFNPAGSADQAEA